MGVNVGVLKTCVRDYIMEAKRGSAVDACSIPNAGPCKKEEVLEVVLEDEAFL